MPALGFSSGDFYCVISGVIQPGKWPCEQKSRIRSGSREPGHWSWGCRAGSDLRSPQGACLCDMQLIAYLGVEIKFDVAPCAVCHQQVFSLCWHSVPVGVLVVVQTALLRGNYSRPALILPCSPDRLFLCGFDGCFLPMASKHVCFRLLQSISCPTGAIPARALSFRRLNNKRSDALDRAHPRFPLACPLQSCNSLSTCWDAKPLATRQRRNRPQT